MMSLRALGTLVPVYVLFYGSVVLFSCRMSAWSFVRIVAAARPMVVVVTRICEALHLAALGDMSIASVIISIYGAHDKRPTTPVDGHRGLQPAE